jgi:hypothetical protein
MQQRPARRLQRLVNVGPIQEIALAGGDEALEAMASVHFQQVSAENATRGAPLANGERGDCNIIGGAEIGADSAPLGAKLFQLMFGKEAEQTSGNGLRFGG